MNEELLPEREKILDETSDEIGQHLNGLEEICSEVRDLSLEKPSLLLVDSTFSSATRHIQRGLAMLKARGIEDPVWDTLATLYVQKLFSGHMPENALDLFKNFFGDSVNLTHLPIGKTDGLLKEGFSGVIFSGSPADVTKGIVTPNRPAVPFARTTNGQVLERATRIYQEAAKHNLPVIGICYGHQMISRARGGGVVRIAKDGEMLIGDKAVESVGIGTEYVAAARGNLAAYFGEHVLPNVAKSTLFLRNSGDGIQTVHGLIHIADDTFSGDTVHDAEIVKSLLEDGRHVALTVQPHPEYTGPARLINFSLRNDVTAMIEPRSDLLTPQMLGMFNRFIGAHGK